MIEISDIESRLQKAEARAKKAQAAFDAATVEVNRLRTALSVFRELAGVSAAADGPSSQFTDRQTFLFNSLKIGKHNAESPVDIFQVVSKISGFTGDVDYVRTTLWRMAKKGLIGSGNGAYWRFDQPIEAAESSDPVDAGNADPMWDESPADFQPWDDVDEAPF